MAADLILLMKWKRLQLTGGKAWRIIPEYLVKNISVWISTRGSVKKKKKFGRADYFTSLNSIVKRNVVRR